MSTKIPNEPHKAVLWTAVGATVVIAVGAFVLSFAALTDLAQRSGIEAHLAWIWPIIVDGMIVAATVAIVALNGHSARAMIYPWSLLFFGATVSTAANAVHAILTVDKMSSTIPPLVSALVAAMPPVVLLAITHLTVHMYQMRAAAAQQRAELEASAAAEVEAQNLYADGYDAGWLAAQAEIAAAQEAHTQDGLAQDEDADAGEPIDDVDAEFAAVLAESQTAQSQTTQSRTAGPARNQQVHDAPAGPEAEPASVDGPAPLYDEALQALPSEEEAKKA
ncbi:hypothetical protein GCM10023081_41200 [Arthrobacter ginkgonis]|uniref:Excisionase n=1 Tax=Arthrobacter ginkgonis TaxID=1630594 RepID=A0ABP7D334_9MICC